MSRSSGVNPKNIQKNSADNLFKIRFLRDSVVTKTRGESGIAISISVLDLPHRRYLPLQRSVPSSRLVRFGTFEVDLR